MLTRFAVNNDPLPLKAGCWVMRGTGAHIEIARVKDCYWESGRVVMDLSIYDVNGTRVGRTSPAMGGPKTFEPACDLGDWKRIAKPKFPLDMLWLPVPEDLNRLSPSFEKSVQRMEFGKFVERNSVQAPLPLPPKSDYNPDLEASAKRMAAQELRDQARMIPEAADALRARAQVLEDEADRIAPRSLA